MVPLVQSPYPPLPCVPRLECHLHLCADLGLPVRPCPSHPTPGRLSRQRPGPRSPLSPVTPSLSLLREPTDRSLARVSEAVSPGNYGPEKTPGVFGSFRNPRTSAPRCQRGEQPAKCGRARWSRGAGSLGQGRTGLAVALEGSLEGAERGHRKKGSPDPKHRRRCVAGLVNLALFHKG